MSYEDYYACDWDLTWYTLGSESPVLLMSGVRAEIKYPQGRREKCFIHITEMNAVTLTINIKVTVYFKMVM